MAITQTLSNHYHYQLMKKQIDLSADVLKLILMGPEFVFDKDAHATLADTKKTAWQASTAYAESDIIEPTTPNGHSFKCTTAGTSGESEPGTWNTGNGETTTDNSVTWTEEKTDVQLPTGYGYMQDNKTLDNKVLSEDDANDRARMTCDDPSWTADGGEIGPIGSSLIIDDTTSDDTVIGCIDYGTDYTIPNGSTFVNENIIIDNQDQA